MKKSIFFSVSNDITFDQRMLRICTTLTHAGYDVTIAGRQRNNEVENNFDFKTKRFKCFFNAGKLFYVELNIRVFFFLLFRKFDVLCAVDLDTALSVYVAAKIKSIPFGIDAHEYFQEVPEVVNRRRIKKIWEWVGRKTIPKTAFRYTVSSSLAKEFEALYGVPFDVVRNVPVFFSPREVENSSPYILYQGSLNEGRGLETLIKTAPLLKIPIKIAGEGDLSVELRQLAASLNVTNRVEFLGYLKPEALREVTKKAFLGFNLLENKGLSYYYSLANKFFDYTMAGVPCLNPPFPEYIALYKSHQIGIITPLREACIAAAVNALYNDKQQHALWRANALKAAETFNWENEKNVLLQIYEEIF